MSDNMPTANSGENIPGEQIHATRESEAAHQLDTVFECIRSARSRHLLYYLSDNEGTAISTEEAIEAVLRYEAADVETNELPPRQSVRKSLIDTHLPRLWAAGVLTHDPRRGVIHFDGNAQLEEWLERSRRLESY